MESIRIIELPKCKMVSSGVQTEFDFSESGALGKFGRWWTEVNKNRKDHFYNRDYIWYDDSQGGLIWGYVIYDGLDTGEYEIIDFPGGLYAVATYIDGNQDDNTLTYNAVKEWVNDSKGFELDNSRPALGQISSPYGEDVKAALGYEQMDCYIPIKITKY